MAGAGYRCRICGHSGSPALFSVPEMMFGWGEEFRYAQCARCGCLQLANPPPDLARYYPTSYYSVGQEPVAIDGNSLRRIALTLRDRYALYDRGLLGRFLYARFPNEALRSLSGVPGLSVETRILDVGCGSGTLLYRLRERGFCHLLGIDPSLEHDIHYANDLLVRRQTLDEVEGRWDVVMFHHSFEHLADPLGALRHVARLVPPGGTCLLRMPVVPCCAWERYGVHWVQLDAPRHLFIYSQKGVQLLGEKTGWALAKVVFDSTEFQFWGSEQYEQGIPLMAPNSYAVNPRGSRFSKRDIACFRAKARRLNAQGQGDSAAFYLRRTGEVDCGIGTEVG